MFGIGFTKKLKNRIAELENMTLEDAKKVVEMVKYHKGQISIRDGENFTLKERISTLEASVKSKDAAIDTWMEKSKADQTKVDILESKLGLAETKLKAPVLAPEVVEKKSKTARPSKLEAYYNRGKMKKK